MWRQFLLQDNDQVLEDQLSAPSTTKDIDRQNSNSSTMGDILESVENEIWRDVRRTRNTNPLFRQQGGCVQSYLAHILKIVAIVNRYTIGYCQGMNYVAAALLEEMLMTHVINTNDTRSLRVQKIYSLLKPNCQNTKIITELMDILINHSHLQMKGIWRRGLPVLKLRMHQFDCLVANKLPMLHAHFHNIGLLCSQYCAQWFVTLFSSSVSIDETKNVWNLIFLGGWVMIFRLSLAILDIHRLDLISMQLEDVSRFFQKLKTSFKNKSRNSGANLDGLDLHKVMIWSDKYDVSSELLVQIEKKYVADNIESTISRLPKSTDLILQYKNLKILYQNDCACLREKIEFADASLHEATSFSASADSSCESLKYKLTTQIQKIKSNRNLYEKGPAISTAHLIEQQQKELAQTYEEYQHAILLKRTANSRKDEAKVWKEKLSRQLITLMKQHDDDLCRIGSKIMRTLS